MKKVSKYACKKRLVPVPVMPVGKKQVPIWGVLSESDLKKPENSKYLEKVKEYFNNRFLVHFWILDDVVKESKLTKPFIDKLLKLCCLREVVYKVFTSDRKVHVPSKAFFWENPDVACDSQILENLQKESFGNLPVEDEELGKISSEDALASTIDNMLTLGNFTFARWLIELQILRKINYK